jgi:hypothetical protein
MHREERRRHATKPHQRTTPAVFARATQAVRQSQRLFQSRTRLASHISAIGANATSEAGARRADVPTQGSSEV